MSLFVHNKTLPVKDQLVLAPHKVDIADIGVIFLYSFFYGLFPEGDFTCVVWGGINVKNQTSTVSR